MKRSLSDRTGARLLRCFACLCSLPAGGPTAAGALSDGIAATSVQQPPPLAAKVDEYVAPLVAMRDFSGTVLVARRGIVLASSSYGSAALDGTTLPSESSSFGVGSITKTFTAAAIVQLAEAGKLSLSDPVSKFLPGFVPGREITLTHLLAHSSGLKDYYSWPSYATGRDRPIGRQAFLAELAAQPLDFAPGERSSYSNSGYFLLAAIVEVVSGEPYGEYLERHLFAPLGMKTAGVLTDDVQPDGLAPGFDPGFPPEWIRPAAKPSRSWLYGSGSVYASAGDLHRWLEATRSGSLIRIDRLPYPYGWGRRQRFGRAMLEQSGRIPIGYASYAGLYPDEDLAVIVLSNIQVDVTERMGIDLAAMALGEEYSLPRIRAIGDSRADAKALAASAGRYEIAPGFELTVREEPGGLSLAGPDGAFLPLDHQQGDRFFFRPLYVSVGFTRDGEGRVNALDWNGVAQARRLPDP